MPDDNGRMESKVLRRIQMGYEVPKMSLNGIQNLMPRGGTAESGHQVKASDHFKCPNCGKTHHTASFVKCEYCGFGRQTPKTIMGPACSAVINPYGFTAVKPESRSIKGF